MESPVDGFAELTKHTLFINLESRRDRLEHIVAEMEKMGLLAERVNAVKMSIGAIGCTLSHIKCLELAKERDYEHVFICEDDIQFLNPDLLKTNMCTFYENMQNLGSWDVLIIGGNNVPPYQQIEPYCARVFYCQTTTGYIVRRAYYDTLIQNFKESAENLMRHPDRPRDFAIDMYWKRLQHQGFWYMITPPTVTQYESYSDIESRTVNYDHLMLDMEKIWYVNQQRQLAKMGMTFM